MVILKVYIHFDCHYTLEFLPQQGLYPSVEEYCHKWLGFQFRMAREKDILIKRIHVSSYLIKGQLNGKMD